VSARPEHDPRAAALRAARTQDSQDKRRRVLDALQALEKAGAPVTAARLAATAGVSTWLVYADGVREHVDAARRRQAEHPSPSAPAALPTGREPATPASLRTDLAVARAEIRRLRAEHDKLRGRLRLHLGAEIDGPDRAELIARVAELDAIARQLLAERDAHAAEADHARRQVRELEDDLTAARESLRRVIRETNS
jgi:hypothetical protein